MEVEPTDAVMVESTFMHAIIPPFFQSVVCLGLLFAGFLVVSTAQVSTDGSVGPQTTLTGPDFTIGHELGQVRGGNLLHSFRDFNLNAGEQATFSGPPTIENIISRVTGGNPSLINGLLQSDIAGANLFLLNPNGLLFGASAELNISGSFHASTADTLRFADGQTWPTGIPSQGDFSVAPPSAFGFLGASPVGISIEGSLLTVPEDQAMSFIAGDLDITRSRLRAREGRIHLTSMGAAGDVPLLSSDASAALDLDTLAHTGDIRLTDGAVIDTVDDRGGSVVIRGGNLLIDNAFVRAETRGRGAGGTIDVAMTGHVTIVGDQSGLSTTTRDARGDAGDIRLTAATLEVSDNARIQSRNRGGSGDAGTVVLEVGDLTVTDGGQISASARGGRGDAGSLTITATGQVTIVGDNTGLSVDSSDRGQAGRIRLTAPAVTLRDAGRIRARNDDRRAAAGRIQIDVQHLELLSGGHIDTSAGSRNSDKQAGEIVISADSLLILGADSRIVSSTNGNGVAGSIRIDTRLLSLSEGGQIDTSAQRRDRSGQAGEISISTHELLITGPDSGVASVTRGRGDAGRIRIDTEMLTLTGGAQISAAALLRSTGSGGTVQIVATDRVLITGDGMPGRLPLDVADVTRDEGVSAGTGAYFS